jgi:hypothetical protein
MPKGIPKAGKRQGEKVRKGSFSFEERLYKVAFKPRSVQWGDLAKELGITPAALVNFKKANKERIDELQVEKLEEAKADVDAAHIKRAIGYDHAILGPDKKVKHSIHIPPDVRAIDLYYERLNKLAPQNDVARWDILGWKYPQAHQLGPLFHWDRKWGDNGNNQIIGMIGGRGFSKSVTLAQWALRMARINRGCQIGLTAPSYKMLHNPLQLYLAEALEASGIKYKYRETDKEYHLWGDTVIICRSFDDPDSIRGLTLAGIGADEVRDGSQYAIDIMLACVRDPKAKLLQTLLASTPNGFDHVYDTTANPESGLVKSGRSVLYAGQTRDNTFLPESFISSLEEAYDDETFKQEVLGQFLLIGGGRRIYHKFDRNLHVADLKYDPSLGVEICQDFNYNPMCGCVAQIHTENGYEVVHVIDEIRITGSDTDGACKELKARGYDPSKLGSENIRVYPDASGTQKTAVAGQRSNIAIFRAHGFENLLHPHANPRKLDRYNAVNGMLHNARGQVRLLIDRKCKYLIADLEREQYKEGTSLRDESNKEMGHLADALGYFIHHRYRIESPYDYEYRYA